MDCTYFQEMVLPVAMEDRGIPVVDGLNLRAPIQLQGCLHPQQQQQHQHQQMTSNYYCNPQFTFPAASWSTTDPTLLLAQSQQQELQEQLQQRSTISRSGTCFASVKSGGGGSSSNPDSAVGYVDPYTDCCGFSPMPSFDHTVAIGDHYLQNVGFIDSDDDHLGNLPLDAIGGMYNCNGAANERIPSHGADPYSVGASGLIMNPAESSLAPLQWSQQSCSLLASDQYCSDGLMPQLVSDYYSHSSEVHHQPTYCNNSSASVECGSGMHEADSCGNSERDRSTTSEEINWANSTINNSDQAMIQQPHSFDNLGCVAGRPTTGMMLPSPIGRREHTEEYSSTFVAAMGDKVEFAPNQTHIIAAHDLTQHHLGNSSISSMTTKYSGVRTAPVERASWMAPVSTTNSQVMGKTHVQNLDHLRMLGTSSAGQLANAVGSGSNCNDSLRLPPPASLNTFNYSQQQRACYTLDSIPLSTNTRPLSVMPSQNLRMNSGYPMAPLMEQRTVAEGATSNNLYKQLLGGFTRTPLAGSGPAQAPKPILAAAQENSARGFGFRRDYGTGSDQPRLSSPCRKQAATSIEPQSVAARHRRKKISERVRLLEKLIPGGSKMDTASMFDEAIEYVKFLQLQVQLLEGMGEADKSPMEINTQLTAPTGTDAVAAECPTSSVASSTMTSAATSSSASRPSINLFNSGNSVSSRVNNNSHVAGVSSSFGSSVLSATLLQQSMLKPAGATPGAASNSPLILSEILQDQLFKQKLCLVSLHQYQYCPQQQPPAQPLVSSTRHGSR